ncbi:MAG TPA: response regulator, partial [Nannocystaceae bacterium]|nr:response regulator [Nannocystaceae bacterium]
MTDAHAAIAGAQLLIIDDHRDLAANLGELLADAGAVVEEAGNAHDGLERARLGFDVALVDVRLPDALGLALVPRLRALDPLAAIVLITGHASIDDAISAVRAGAYAYVLKPFDSGELLVTLGRAVEQVRLARRAATLQRALERSEAELRTLVDTVEALLLVLDERGRILHANAAVATATGVPLAELYGAEWIERFVPRAEHATVASTLERVRSGESGVALESRVLGRVGTEVYEHLVRWRLAGLATDTGFRIYASGIDMTDVRALERRTRLAEKLAAVGTVSAGLAHEIRNPLNAAGLQLQLLERRIAKLSADARVREPLALVHAEIARLSRLV